MRIQQSWRVGLFQKLVILFFLSFLACGEKKTTVAGLNKKLTLVTQEKQHKLQRQQRQEEQHVKHSFDLFSSSKRRVPNASDPLHNR